MDLKGLFERAFFSEDVDNASVSIDKARDKFIELYKTGAESLEYVVPTDPADDWIRERLLRSITFYCESEGRPIPKCAGVFASLFAGHTLYCIAIPDVIAWAVEEFGASVEALRRTYGTQESDTALR